MRTRGNRDVAMSAELSIRRLDPEGATALPQIGRANLLYFALVFGAGFALEPLRLLSSSFSMYIAEMEIGT